MVHIVSTKQAKNASAEYIWSKLSKYSDFAWHPSIVTSKDIGSIPDGSDNMIGAVRLLVNDSGKELVETVTKWDEDMMYYACSIDKGGPPIAKYVEVGFRVREDPMNKKIVYVDTIMDLKLKGPFIILKPILKKVLPSKIGQLTSGITELVEQ